MTTPEEWLMSPGGDSGLVQENLLLGLGDGMQINGVTPPGGGGGGGNCLYLDTVLTWYIVSNGKVLAEYDGLTKALNYKFMYAGDQRIAMRDGQNRLHYYLNDHLGSARVVIDSAGTIKDKYHYLAFGSPLDVTFSTGQPNRYTGKPYDMDAGMNLYYYGARYYDAELGRFTQVDPARASRSGSTYAYAADNPLSWLDPDGAAEIPYHMTVRGIAEGLWNYLANRVTTAKSRVATDIHTYYTAPTDRGAIFSFWGGVGIMAYSGQWEFALPSFAASGLLGTASLIGSTAEYVLTPNDATFTAVGTKSAGKTASIGLKYIFGKTATGKMVILVFDAFGKLLTVLSPEQMKRDDDSGVTPQNATSLGMGVPSDPDDPYGPAFQNFVKETQKSAQEEIAEHNKKRD